MWWGRVMVVVVSVEGEGGRTAWFVCCGHRLEGRKEKGRDTHTNRQQPQPPPKPTKEKRWSASPSSARFPCRSNWNRFTSASLSATDSAPPPPAPAAAEEDDAAAAAALLLPAPAAAAVAIGVQWWWWCEMCFSPFRLVETDGGYVHCL